MIESWRDDWLRDFFTASKFSKKIPADLRNRLFRKLQLIDDAANEADLAVPPGNRFEHLSGSLDGWCSIRVSEQWRLIFRWKDGNAAEVYLDDHSYR